MTPADDVPACQAAGLDALIQPGCVVIVGASDKGPTARIKADLERTGFAGGLYPVNPRRDTLWGGKCYPAVGAVPARADHVIISVPAAAVPGALTEALDSGARSVAIHAVGFGEGDSADGRALAQRIRDIAARYSVPVAGPSFGGLFRADSGLMTISLTRAGREGSPVALIGQSGGVLMFTYEALVDRGISPTTLIASGSELLLGCADYIRYLADDENIRVIGCFIESIKDVAKFRAAAQAARANGKRVVVLKVGASPGGRAAALAHTGSIVGSLAAFETLAEELGVLTAHTQDELIDGIELLLNAPVLPGPRIGVISHSGGLKDLLMDYASRQGVTFPALAPQTLEYLAGLLGPGSSLGNPLDTGFPGLSNPDVYLSCVEVVAADPNIDVVLVQEELPRSPQKAREELYLRNLSALTQRERPLPKPVGSMSLASYSLTEYARAVRAELPGIFVLQEASRALAVVTRAGAAAAAAPAGAPEPAANPAAAELRARLSALRRAGAPVTLSEHDSKGLLTAYGIPVTRERTADSAEAAVAAAREIGYPVVLKLSGADVAHKSDVGGVLLDLRDADQVRAGFEKLAARRAAGVGDTTAGAAGDVTGAAVEVLVAEFVKGEVEVMLGVMLDPEVGPVVAVGSGGTAVELLDDVAVALPRLDAPAAAALFARTRAGRLVAGHRGKILDRDGVVRALTALASLTRDLGDLLAAVDINPLTVTDDRVCALDALVVLAPLAE